MMGRALSDVQTHACTRARALQQAHQQILSHFSLLTLGALRTQNAHAHAPDRDRTNIFRAQCLVGGWCTSAPHRFNACATPRSASRCHNCLGGTAAECKGMDSRMSTTWKEHAPNGRTTKMAGHQWQSSHPEAARHGTRLVCQRRLLMLDHTQVHGTVPETL